MHRYSYIFKNKVGVDGLISDKIQITSYIPIPPSDMFKFLFELTNKIKEEFENSNILETDIIYISVLRKKSRVMTFLDFEYRTYPNFNLVAEVTLELPKLEYELIFSLTEEIKDFFQENLC